MNNREQQLKHRLTLLTTNENGHLLTGGLRGIERETLRVNVNGQINLSEHPVTLGSALTHPKITTDYSEALLEFITSASINCEVALGELDEIHRFAYTELGEQMLWSQSMPCDLPDEQDIPIACYGQSHIGMLKHVYRRGLAVRYGKSMQCIAGIHYNYSVDDAIWSVLHDSAIHLTDEEKKDVQSEGYIALIKNFNRYNWLLMYLFGASPALLSNFLRGKNHQLNVLSEDTLYLPYATSLRMSDLGYQNNAQDGLMPPYNTLMEYMRSLSRAVSKPYAPYEAIGAQKNGEWIQINTNVLQIENEFYATIRPKRVINAGERPVEALCSRGVQYVEVRCMDINPFEPLGINLETSRFLDVFLLFCILIESPQTNQKEWLENTSNFAKTVKEGRKPDLKLQHLGSDVGLVSWGLDLLTQMTEVAQVLDEQNGGTAFMQSLEAQKEKLLNPDKTPSAQVLAAINAHDGSFTKFALAQSKIFADDFKSRSLSDEQLNAFKAMVQTSLTEQAHIERVQVGDFDSFINDYRSRTSSQKTCCSTEDDVGK